MIWGKTPLFLETSTKAVGQAADKRREEFERLQEFQPRIGGHGLRAIFCRGGFIRKGEKAHERLGGGFKHFLFSPLPGEMIQFD